MRHLFVLVALFGALFLGALTDNSKPQVLERIYPNVSQSRGYGTITLNVKVAADGQADDVTILQGYEKPIDNALAKAVKQWKFAPAVVNGQAVDATLVIEVPYPFDTSGQPAPESDSNPVITNVTGKNQFGANLAEPRVMSKVDPVYPALAKQNGIIGTVTMEVLVNTDGKVSEIRQLTYLEVSCDQAAKEAVHKWIFQAAQTKSGTTVPRWLQVSISFGDISTPSPFDGLLVAMGNLPDYPRYNLFAQEDGVWAYTSGFEREQAQQLTLDSTDEEQSRQVRQIMADHPDIAKAIAQLRNYPQLKGVGIRLNRRTQYLFTR